MAQWLLRLFVKEYEQVDNPRVRSRYGSLAGIAGIFLNVCLFAAKLAAGILTSSISITADAFNNLSDAGSSTVTLVSFKMAEKPPDKEHPFGHGRVEYLAALLISLAILLVGVELLKSSVDKILHPEPVVFGWLSVGILAVSVLVKLWMAYFNRVLGKKIRSSAMLATSMDSLTDAVATTAVLVGIGAGQLFHIYLDPWLGILVALFILYTGFSTARDSLTPLLGQAPEAAFVLDIQQTVLAHPEIIGIHDLIVHDYGPGRRIISLHAEVSARSDMLAIHDVIDRIELELRGKFGCDTTIHMDPVALDDEETQALRRRVEELVRGIDPAVTIHDFRMVRGATHTNLIFDVLVPHRFHMDKKELASRIRAAVQEIDSRYFAVIRVEQSFLAD